MMTLLAVLFIVGVFTLALTVVTVTIVRSETRRQRVKRLERDR